MPRLPRFAPVGIPQHIIQRGNNRQPCFCEEHDYGVYTHFLKSAAAKFSVDIHAWCFMTNHVHLLATPKIEGAVSSMMQSLGRQYVQYFNHKLGTGSDQRNTLINRTKGLKFLYYPPLNAPFWQ